MNWWVANRRSLTGARLIYQHQRSWRHLFRDDEYSRPKKRSIFDPTRCTLLLILYHMTLENNDDNNDEDESSPDGIYFAAVKFYSKYVGKSGQLRKHGFGS